MKKCKLISSILILFLANISPTWADEPAYQNAPLIIFDSSGESTNDPDNVPLDPKNYYPLGMGIRKDSNTSLVPFCIALHRVEKNCTYAQYFEVESGEFRDSDRAMNTTYGAPRDRVAGQEFAFHGKAIGVPFTGYVFGSGAFDEELQKYLAGFKLPESFTFFEAENDLALSDPGTFGLSLFTGIVGGLIGGLFKMPAYGEFNTRNMGRGAAIGAVAPHVVILGMSIHSQLHLKKVKRQIARRGARILDAFSESKKISENWTLIKGVRVPERTYDTFVEFLQSRK